MNKFTWAAIAAILGRVWISRWRAGFRSDFKFHPFAPSAPPQSHPSPTADIRSLEGQIQALRRELQAAGRQEYERSRRTATRKGLGFAAATLLLCCATLSVYRSSTGDPARLTVEGAVLVVGDPGLNLELENIELHFQIGAGPHTSTPSDIPDVWFSPDDAMNVLGRPKTPVTLTMTFAHSVQAVGKRIALQLTGPITLERGESTCYCKTQLVEGSTVDTGHPYQLWVVTLPSLPTGFESGPMTIEVSGFAEQPLSDKRGRQAFVQFPYIGKFHVSDEDQTALPTPDSKLLALPVIHDWNEAVSGWEALPEVAYTASVLGLDPAEVLASSAGTPPETAADYMNETATPPARSVHQPLLSSGVFSWRNNVLSPWILWRDNDYEEWRNFISLSVGVLGGLASAAALGAAQALMEAPRRPRRQ